MYWAGPDKQGTEYAGGGDPSFFFVLDLGATITVAKLRIRNCLYASVCSYYSVQDFAVSMSESATDGFGAEMTGSLQLQHNTIQDVPIELTGRYLKFVAKTYGDYSAGLEYLEVLQ